MEFKEIVSITSLSGLYQVRTQRQDGMIVNSLEDSSSRFVSGRVHTFTFLENISIYTQNKGDEDNKDLLDVLLKMKEKGKTNPPVKSTVNTKELKSYFETIVPDYDPERVYVSDIKKILKWYEVLDKHKLIVKPKEEKDKTEEKELQTSETSNKQAGQLAKKTTTAPKRVSVPKAAGKLATTKKTGAKKI